MVEFLDEIIAEFIEETSNENGEQTFVYIPERGVMVNIETCNSVELIDAAIAQLEKEVDELNQSLALIRRREAELESGCVKYRVVWDDHEGNEQERAFDSLEDAWLEADDLRGKFEGVKVLDANGNPMT